MTLKELDEWTLTQLDNIVEGYCLHKIIYWRLIEQNCTLVLRDREWFESQLSTYNKIWGYVEYLRKNLDVAIEWKEWIGLQPRKYNEKIIAKLDLLIEQKKNPTHIINVVINSLDNQDNNKNYNLNDNNNLDDESDNVVQEQIVKNEITEDILVNSNDKIKRKYIRKQK
jgi:hypothetical protein